MTRPETVLSLLIPARNAEKHLEACLKSIEIALEGAFFDTERDVEILILDDGSTDATPQILSQAAERIEKLHLLPRHTEALGVSESRNDLIEAASGQYIWFVDADDLIEPCSLQCFSEITASGDPDIIFVGYKVFSGQTPDAGPKRKPSVSSRTFAGSATASASLEAQFANGQLQMWSKIHKRALYRDERIFPPNRIFEDVSATTLLTLRASTFFYDENVWLSYRKHPDSAVSSTKLEKELDRCSALIETAWLLQRSDRPVSEKAISQFRIFAAKHLEKSYRALVKWPSQNEAKEAYETLRAKFLEAPPNFERAIWLGLLTSGHLVRLMRLRHANRLVKKRFDGTTRKS